MGRLTLSIDDALLSEIKRYVPPRQRSRFVAEALEGRLLWLKQAQMIKETSGAWRDADHPELAELGVENYVRRLRRWKGEGA